MSASTEAVNRRAIAGHYEVGYGKPPAANQFKLGQSGNPRGRPRGARNKPRDDVRRKITDIVLEESHRTIRVQEGGRIRNLTIAQAVVRSISVAAMKGQTRAQKLLVQLLSHAEIDKESRALVNFRALLEYKINCEQELNRCRQEGIVAPCFCPHPDDIVVDVRAGTARIEGPLTEKEKPHWERLRRSKKTMIEAIPYLETALAEEQDPDTRQSLEEDLAQARKAFAAIARVITD